MYGEKLRATTAQRLSRIGEQVFRVYKDAAERDYVSHATRLAGNIGNSVLHMAEVIAPHRHEAAREDLPK